MGYVAARGGLDAIVAAEALLADRRAATSGSDIAAQLPATVDRVMGEGGLWAPELAASALLQADGDLFDAAHLVRSHRSTLPRFGHSEAVDVVEMDILRRVVPAYQRPPGPQLLGRTADYALRRLQLPPDPVAGCTTTPRLDRLVTASLEAHVDDAGADGSSLVATPATNGGGNGARITPDGADRTPRPLLEVLREQDLLVDRRRRDDPEPVDIAQVAVRPPAPRSARLAAMARAETGALVNLWYRNILGPDGYLHEITLGEVRHGRLPVRALHPELDTPVEIGSVRATYVEAIEDLDGHDEDRSRFDVGIGCCLGHNETKAIAMANLDIACERDGGASGLEQSVLMTTDGLDASGFLQHLKLPHYVTFRSMVERKAAVRRASRPADPEMST